MRRRNFAASMVVTVSLAELACTSSVSTSNPPPAEDSGAEASDLVDPPAEAPPPQEPEPVPEGDPPPPDPVVDNASKIEVQLDGTCMEFFSTDCPEGTKCNPPPPRKVECPQDALPKPSEPKLVTRRNDGTCWEETRIDPDACPKGVACNPPPPHRVQCPDSAFPKAKNPKNVNKRSDGSCWEFINVKCQPDATCNPPPPQRVRCEPEDTSVAPGARPLKKTR